MSRRPSPSNPLRTLEGSSHRHEFLMPRTHAPLASLFHPEAVNALRSGGEGPARLRAVPEGDATSEHHELYTRYVLPVHGQGTVMFELNMATPFRIVLSDQQTQSRGERKVLVLEVGPERTCFRQRNNDAEKDVLASTQEQAALLDVGMERRYWFSVDKKNRRLRFGKGYMQARLTVFEHALPPMLEPDSTQEDPFAWMEQLQYIALCGDFGSTDVNAIGHALWPLPVTVDQSPYVIQSEEITLEELEAGTFTVAGSLPAACQQLYANVAGPSINLQPADFPDFADAVTHSILTPGAMCFEKLKEKQGEFGEGEPNATYLRVTLGVDQGNSPGVPYVMEIWPGGHYSPIHSHSDSYAIIKVLHGSITSEYYPELNTELLRYYRKATLREGDVTWLSPDFYQTHRLRNEGEPWQTCITIQCYQYGAADRRHYEFFDYIDESAKQVRQFLPHSDWSYGDFKAQLKEEWTRFKAQNRVD